MHIYGRCPAKDDFFLVVCNHCSQVVKPQAFEKHCEWRHGPLTKMCGQSSTLAPQQRPRPGRPTSNLSSSRERQKSARCHRGAVQSSAALPVYQHKTAKSQEAVRYCLLLTNTRQVNYADLVCHKFFLKTSVLFVLLLLLLLC